MGPENFYRVAGFLLEHDPALEEQLGLTAAADTLAELSAIPRVNVPAMAIKVAAIDADAVRSALVLAVAVLGLAPDAFPDLA